MTVAMADDSLPISVVTALYLRTKTLHLEAERSGIIRELLRGNASRDGYNLLLRNLPACLPDDGTKVLLTIAKHPASEPLRHFRLDRAPAIAVGPRRPLR